MVRGCQRKVIFLKNTESKIFSEAYSTEYAEELTDICERKIKALSVENRNE